MDLIPAAIELARVFAAERGLEVNYAVQDIVELPVQGKQYDLIVDSYCLQCIVFDQDRQKVFAAVRGRLKAGGYYLVSTAMFDKLRFRARELVIDQDTQAQFHHYGTVDLIGETTVYSPIEQRARRPDLHQQPIYLTRSTRKPAD
jgi:2-polyprenyl-3-methyl-5-hydroxy-6-metoxy-1,4-benzoquinol methylase